MSAAQRPGWWKLAEDRVIAGPFVDRVDAELAEPPEGEPWEHEEAPCRGSNRPLPEPRIVAIVGSGGAVR
jgi:hypothetical protein